MGAYREDGFPQWPYPNGPKMHLKSQLRLRSRNGQFLSCYQVVPLSSHFFSRIHHDHCWNCKNLQWKRLFLPNLCLLYWFSFNAMCVSYLLHLFIFIFSEEKLFWLHTKVRYTIKQSFDMWVRLEVRKIIQCHWNSFHLIYIILT